MGNGFAENTSSADGGLKLQQHNSLRPPLSTPPSRPTHVGVGLYLLMLASFLESCVIPENGWHGGGGGGLWGLEPLTLHLAWKSPRSSSRLLFLICFSAVHSR